MAAWLEGWNYENEFPFLNHSAIDLSVIFPIKLERRIYWPASKLLIKPVCARFVLETPRSYKYSCSVDHKLAVQVSKKRRRI